MATKQEVGMLCVASQSVVLGLRAGGRDDLT